MPRVALPPEAERLAWYIRELLSGETAAFVALATACGYAVQNDDGWLTLRRTDLTVGIAPRRTDPTATIAQVALAILGPLWPQVPWMTPLMTMLQGEETQRLKVHRDAVHAASTAGALRARHELITDPVILAALDVTVNMFTEEEDV